MKSVGRCLALCLIFFVLLTVVPLPTYGKTVYIEHDRTRAEIVDWARRLEHAEFDYEADFSLYLAECRREDSAASDQASVEHQIARTYIDQVFFKDPPLLIAPYAAGALNSEPLAHGLNALRMVRYLAGLPSDNLKLKDELNISAQHRAVLATILDSREATPQKPANMSEAFYNTASADVLASKGKELSYASLSSAVSITSIAEVILELVRNPGSTHIASAEHRMTLLDPSITEFGFGYANDYSKPSSSSVFADLGIWGHYYYLHTENPDSTLGSSFTGYLAWPNSGDFPIQYFAGNNYRQRMPTYPWTVTLGMDYQVPAKESIVLELTRKRDGLVWIFDQQTPNLQEDAGDYSNHSLDHLSVHGKTLVFRPNLRDLGTIQNEDVFTVSLSGIKTSAGASAALVYDITFFDLDKELQALGDRFQIVSTLPAVGSMEVSLEPVIELLFNIPIVSLAEGAVTLHKEHLSSEPVATEVQIDQSNHALLRIRVVSPLEADTWYRVRIRPNSLTVGKNIYFRGLTRDEDFYFRTALPKGDLKPEPRVEQIVPQPAPRVEQIVPQEATIEPKTSEVEMGALLVKRGEPRILVIIPEVLQGQESLISVVEGLVIDELIAYDFLVAASSALGSNEIRRSLAGTPDDFGYSLEADFLVMGLASGSPVADVHGLLSYRGIVEVQIVDLLAQQIVGVHRQEEVGLDITEQGAASKALEKAGDGIAKYVASALAKLIKDEE